MTALTDTIAVAPPAPATRDNKWIVAVAVTFGTLMGAIDSSIVNVALPHIRGTVGATVEQITAISTSFIIANVLVMPLTGFLGRMFGQKRVYMACLAIFIAGSAMCGTAHSLGALVFWRTIQGLGAGALQPTEQAILRQTFTKEEQGTAMALFAMAVMVGPAVGPTLGGYITDTYSWPWIFYINLPVGLLGLFMVWRFVHEPEDLVAANRAAAATLRSHIDWAGIGMLWLGLGTLQYLLEEGSRYDWFESGWMQLCAVTSFFSLSSFVIHELTTDYPVVDLRLFRDGAFASATVIGAMMFAMLIGSMFLLPVFMQELLGYSATQSGLTLMPRTLVMMAATPIVGKLYNRVHPGVLIAVGVLLFSLGSYQMSHITLQSGSRDLIWALGTTGVGFSCLFVPLNTAALGSIPRAKLQDATGLNSLMRQIGGSMGLTIFATLLTHAGVQARATVGAHVVPTLPLVHARLVGLEAAMVAQGRDAGTAHVMAVGSLTGEVARQAMVLAFEHVFLIQGIAFLAVLPLLFFLKVDRSAAPVDVDAH